MQDFIFGKEFLDEWSARFPLAEIHRYDDAGHYLLEDATEEVVATMHRFMTTHARS